MSMTCPHCGQSLNSQDPLVGQQVQCPNCKRYITAVNISPIVPTQTEINLVSLRDPKEYTAFGWLIFFSIIVWIIVVLWIISSVGIALIIIGLIALVRWLIGLFVLAHIKTNAVQVSEKQFPEIYNIAKQFAGRLGQELPEIYVIQESTWNALATRLGRQRQVILLSGAVDSLLLKGNIKQLAWVVGHELGHHYAGHLNFWRDATAKMGSWFIWVGLWYRRRCELTCDRYGLACAENLADSLRALCNMAVGSQLASQVDIDEAIAQWQRYRYEFIVRYRTLYSVHPPLLARLEELLNSSRNLGIQ